MNSSETAKAQQQIYNHRKAKLQMFDPQKLNKQDKYDLKVVVKTIQQKYQLSDNCNIENIDLYRNALNHYCQCLLYSDKYDIKCTLKIISIWFKFENDPQINEIISQYFIQSTMNEYPVIEIRKVVYVMYQLFTKLSDSDGLSIKNLQLIIYLFNFPFL